MTENKRVGTAVLVDYSASLRMAMYWILHNFGVEITLNWGTSSPQARRNN